MFKLVLLGGGNLAHHLFAVFSQLPSVQLVQCYNRNIDAIREFEASTSITDDLSTIKEADMYLLTVSDDAIEEVAAALPFRNRLVVHTSGTASIKNIAPNNRRGVFYPLQSFTKEKQIDWKNIPLCLEAENDHDMKLIKTLAAEISPKVFEINSEQRKTIHLVAVFVNNFVNHLFTIGNKLCEENNIPFEVLMPLIEETFEKIKTTPPKEAQTGPAKRGDFHTISAHLNQLSSKEHKEIYQAITTSILNTYGREKL